MLNPNQSIPIGAKVEISPQWFYKAEIEKKKNFNLPQVTSKCSTLWPCIGPKAEKKKEDNIMEFGKPIYNSWSPMFWHFINNILTSMF